jgi:hypothetical protein
MKLALFGELFGTNAISEDNVEVPDLVRQAGGPVFIMSIPITISVCGAEGLYFCAGGLNQTSAGALENSVSYKVRDQRVLVQ